MKKPIVATILLMLWTALLPEKTLTAEVKADSTLLKGEKITARVDGLSCPFCAYGLEKKLKKLKGVEKIQIRVKDGMAVLFLKKGAAVQKREIQRLIKEAGFTPREITVAPLPDEAKKPTASARLTVTGVTCEECIDRVKAAIKDTPCAEVQSVNFEKKEAVLICRGEESRRKAVVDAIEKLGFTVKILDEKEGK